MTEPIFRADELTVIYPGRRGRGAVVANDWLSFSVPAGEVFGLLGPNGAGKTTLVRQMAGLQRPTSGRLTLTLGRPADVIGYLGHRPSALLDLSAREAIVATGRLRGLRLRAAAAAADQLIDELQLGAFAGRRIAKLSTGEARLASLGAALVGDRPVLLLDEPTAELDPANRRLVWEVVRRRQAERGTTVVLVTHNISEAETVFDRLVIMENGRFLVEGTAAEVKALLNGRLRVEMVLRADGPAPLLAGLVYDVRAHGRRRYVGWGDAGRAAEIFAVLAAADLVDYSVGTPTLEDLFLLSGGEGMLAGVSTLVVTAPVAARKIQSPRVLSQFRVVFGIQMARLRAAWSRYVIVATAMPLGIGLVLRAAGGKPSPAEAIQIVSGSVLLAVTLTSVTNLAQRMSVLREQGAFDYYATLPVARPVMLAAVFASYLTFALPGAVLVYLSAVPLFHLQYVWSPMIAVFVLLGSFSLAGLGAWIGLTAGDDQLAAMLANLVMMAVLFLGVVVPDRLPGFLRAARWALPSTYAVEGVKATLAGTATTVRDAAYCGALLGFTALFAPLAARSMHWRRTR